MPFLTLVSLLFDQDQQFFKKGSHHAYKNKDLEIIKILAINSLDMSQVKKSDGGVSGKIVSLSVLLTKAIVDSMQPKTSYYMLIGEPGKEVVVVYKYEGYNSKRYCLEGQLHGVTSKSTITRGYQSFEFDGYPVYIISSFQSAPPPTLPQAELFYFVSEVSVAKAKGLIR